MLLNRDQGLPQLLPHDSRGCVHFSQHVFATIRLLRLFVEYIRALAVYGFQYYRVMASNAGDRTQKRGFDALPPAYITSKFGGQALTGRMSHIAKLLVYGVIGKYVQKRRLPEVGY